jgi:arylsulfatase A-like enzyme
VKLFLDRPNIVFLFTDDQRFDTINALGNKGIITPHMDNLVKDGITFTQAHIPCGTSPAICMPSRAMLLTGRSLFHISGAGERIPEDHITLGETLRRNGYNCYGMGKWHNGPDSFNRVFNDGAEIFFGGMADHWNVPVFNYDPSGKYDNFLPICVDPLFSNKVLKRHSDHVHSGKHSSNIISEAAIKYIENYEQSKPFFMYVSYLAPHDPRIMPKEYLDMYELNAIEIPENFKEEHPFDNGELRVRDELLAPFPRTKEIVRQHIRDYYAMITHLDAQIGRIIKALKYNELYENTILILAGDNGLAIGQHGLFGKQNCYEHSVRVPLIFKGPNISENIQIDTQIFLHDIFPTICGLTDIPIPETVDGIDYSNVIKNKDNRQIRNSLYFAYTDKQRAIKNKEFKLIEYCVRRKHNMTQLFDLKNDPRELNNLAKQGGYADIIRELRTEMFQLKDDWDDKKSRWGRRFWKIFEK